MATFHLRIADPPAPASASGPRAFPLAPSNAYTPFAPQDVGQSIGQRFERQAALHPARIAIAARERTLSYDALNRAANRLARALHDTPDVGAGPVALLLPNGAAFVIASVASLKAGAIQVPLESTFPEARLRYMLQQSDARAIVTDGEHAALARALSSRPVLDIDRVDAALPDGNPGWPIAPDDLAAIGYTSGSTGRPKGIVWNHRGVLHAVMRHTNTYRIAPTDRIAMFRASLRPALYALLNGATYCPVSLREHAAQQLAAWIERERITVFRAAVSVFRGFVASLGPGQTFPGLRLVLLFGEPVYPGDVERFRERFPAAMLGSSLGCNEFDDYACCFVDAHSPLPEAPLPGGYPIAHTQALIVDDGGAPVAVGQVGEIVLRSAYNAVGYWREPEITREAFLPDPAGGDATCYRTGDLGRRDAQGCLYHHGRKDFAVKILGHRVDVAEVEAALLAQGGVRAVAVVGRERVPGTTSLVACIVGSGTPPPRVSELRRALRERLPEYMVPSAFVFVDALPLTATGKVDYRELPAPDATRPALDTPFVAPRNPLEETLAAIWTEVLALDAIGVHDPFLDLGGDSLQAAQIAARVLDRLRVALPLEVLLDAATIAAMAAWIERASGEPLAVGDAAPVIARRH